MQKILALACCSVFAVAICGCGGGDEETASTSSSDSQFNQFSDTSSSETDSGDAAKDEKKTDTSRPDAEEQGGREGQASMEEMMMQREMQESQGGQGGEMNEDAMAAQMEAMMMAESEASGGGERGAEDAMMMEEAMRMEAESSGGGPGMDDEMAMKMQMEMESQMQGEMMGEGMMGGPSKPLPKTLFAKAERAFEDGHDVEGFQYLYAHYLTTPEGNSQHQIHFFPELEAPRTVLRIGLATNYSPPKGFTDRLPKIGDKPNVVPGQGGQGNYGDQMPDESQFYPQEEMMMGGGGRKSDDALGKIDANTGEIGRRILAEFDKRRTEAQAAFGSALANIKYELPESKGGMDGMEGMMGGMDEAAMMAEMGGGGGGSARSKPSYRSEKDLLIPGVVYLGNGTSRDVMKTAEEREVDLLLMFDIRVAKNRRNGLISNTTSVSIYNVATGQKSFKSSSLSNTAHWLAMQRDKDKDTIAEMITKMFATRLDRGFFAQPMPEMSKEQVFNRVRSLITDKEYENPLPVLAEVNYYFAKQLLAENAYLSAVGRLIGKENTTQFATGTPKEKVKAISKWMPREWSKGLEMFEKESRKETATKTSPETAKPPTTFKIDDEPMTDGMSAGDTAAGTELYTSTVQNVFSQACYKCHSSKSRKVKGGFKLDSLTDLMKGGDSGAAVVAGKPDESFLMETLNHTGDVKMPPNKKLSDDEIESVRKWIELGAPIP